MQICTRMEGAAYLEEAKSSVDFGNFRPINAEETKIICNAFFNAIFSKVLKAVSLSPRM